MTHSQKPDFVFRRNGRVHLNRQGRQFTRLLAAEVCASAVVMLDTPSSEVVWRVLVTHFIRQFPIYFPSLKSPCAITFQLDSNIEALQMFASWTLLWCSYYFHYIVVTIFVLIHNNTHITEFYHYYCVLLLFFSVELSSLVSVLILAVCYLLVIRNFETLPYGSILCRLTVLLILSCEICDFLNFFKFVDHTSFLPWCSGPVDKIFWNLSFVNIACRYRSLLPPKVLET